MNKTIVRILSRSAVALLMAAILPSCAMDAPFGDAGEGDLTITTEINGDVIKTRAISTDELAVLREKCIVYIESSRGVVRKYKGVDNIPEQIRLKTGSYVCNAWSGDSVSASFSAKFYRGQEKFDISEGQNSLTVRCNIANVIASVDPASLNVALSDLRVTFSHSRGALEFNETNIPTEKGYFMMPNADKDLSYRIEGKKSDGSDFVKEGKIENVQRAHEYCMTISQDESPVTEGGALIRIEIADIPLIEETIEIFPAPAVRGVDFNIDEQVVSTDRNFKDTRVYVRGYFGLSTLVMNVSDNFSGLTSGVNILESSAMTDLESKGIRVERRSSTDASETAEGGKVDVDEVYVTFSKAFLDGLAASDKEYKVTFEATDGQHKVGTGSLRIANSVDAIEKLAPVVTAPVPTDPMAIGARSATVGGIIYDAANAVNYGIRYRVQGTSAWQEARPEGRGGSHRFTRADNIPYTVTLTGLEPDKTYEYVAFCDGFESSDVQTFTTEGIFTIPNASFEEWSTYQAKTMLGNRSVVLPGSTGDKLTSFWGSGNEGSATVNKTLTNKSEDMAHTGTYSARLASSEAMNILAAGNIFVGHYDRTEEISNGVLSLGRPYNGSHPAKLRFYANYRPGTVNCIKEENLDLIDVVEGAPDHGQVYVALVDEPIEIRTYPGTRKVFDANDVHVLAYGQVTWTSAFGPEGQLEMVEIPIVYNERANTKRPTHLVIVASASKFGDYFSGSSSSVMYLDDFELVYE